MQRMMGLVRRCIEDYRMIEPGDRIAVGVSGGKDSLTLLTLLAALREYVPYSYDLTAITIDMGLGGMDFSPVARRTRALSASQPLSLRPCRCAPPSRALILTNSPPDTMPVFRIMKSCSVIICVAPLMKKRTRAIFFIACSRSSWRK